MSGTSRFDKIEATVVRVKQLFVNGATVAGGLLLGSSEVVDLNGEADALVLSADGNTTISAPTDGKIDFEMNSVDHVIFKQVAGADSGTTNNIVTIAATTPADSTGTNTHNLLAINPTIGNASGGTNTIRGITLGNVTGDAQSTEVGIHVGTGYDVGLEVDTIGETTSAAGVTIDSLLIKDGVSYSRTPFLAVSADGAISVPAYNMTYFITKAGVAAMTIVDPTATTHDGVTLTFVATTANAHTLSNAAGSGFFSSGGGTKDVATFGGAIGDGITIIAYQGKWYIDPRGVTNVTLG